MKDQWQVILPLLSKFGAQINGLPANGKLRGKPIAQSIHLVVSRQTP